MSVPARYRVLKLWDCDDFGSRAVLVDLDWQELPPELRLILKVMP